MRVLVRKAFKSIHVLLEFEIPDFVVLTGKNGSGKSHLMEAQKSGAGGCDGATGLYVEAWQRTEEDL